MIGLLIIGHFLADGPLQPPKMSQEKRDPDPDTRHLALAQHGLIHGAMVGFATGMGSLVLCELILHVIVDRLKGKGYLSTWQDQALHLACKAVWAWIAW